MKDYLVRATAADAQVRAFAATTRQTVETARQNHNTSPVVTAALGRLLTAGAMMGSMLKGKEDLLTLQVTGDGPMGGMTVTADSMGGVKGYANEPQVILPANSQGKLDVGGAVGNGILRVIRDMGLKDPYVGQTALQTGEIAEDLTYYFATSEQVPSSVGLGVLMEKDNTVKQAGGFIVQLMPFAEEETIQKLESNLSKIRSVTSLLDEGVTPEGLLELVLEGMDFQFLETRDVKFACNCSKERVEKALISIGREEIGNMIADGETIEVKCHFCNKGYHFSIPPLKIRQKRRRKAIRRTQRKIRQKIRRRPQRILRRKRQRRLNSHRCFSYSFSFQRPSYSACSPSISFSHSVAQASEGMRRSPLGDTATLPTFGPSGRQERLNCCWKKRR